MIKKFFSNLSIWDKINLFTLPCLGYFALQGDAIATFLVVVGIGFFNDFALVKWVLNKVRK